MPSKGENKTMSMREKDRKGVNADLSWRKEESVEDAGTHGRSR